MTISRRLRFEILRRDAHTCRYCGAKAPDVKLTVDHVVAQALGGKDEATNLVTACQPCNTGKASTTTDSELVDDVAADAIRWAHARKQVIAEWRASRSALAADLEAFTAAWSSWTYTDQHGAEQPVPRDPTWASAIERWLEEGLLIEDIIELLPKAMTRDTIHLEDRWRYFCGVIWRTLDDIQTATTDKVTPADDTDKDTAGPDNPVYLAGFKDGCIYERSRLAAAQPGATTSLCVECGERRPMPNSMLCTECWGY